MVRKIGMARIRAAILVALASCGAVASAAVLGDVANGQLTDAATWGGTAPAAGDTLNIDSNTVSVSVANQPLVPSPLTINLSGDGTNGKLFLNYSLSNVVPGSATLNLNGGGTIEASRTTLFAGGLSVNVAANTRVDANSLSEIQKWGNSTNIATSTVLTGTGTLTKTSVGSWLIASGPHIIDNDPLTAGNQPWDNPTTFSGKYDIQAGLLEVSVPEITKYATVQLGGTVAGTAANTNLEDSPRLNYANGGTSSYTQLQVANLTGSGRVSWNNTSGYYRDVAIGTLLDPGSANEAGLIKRHNAGSKNDLVMRPGSTMAFDVFSASSADQVDWTDVTNISGMVFNEANLKVRLFTPAAETGLLNWTLILADDWILKADQGLSTPAAQASQTFASIQLLNADGSAIAPLWVDGVQSGWKNLGITYGGTAGGRTVVLSGEYVLVPEPAVVSLMAGCGLLLGLRRRRAAW